MFTVADRTMTLNLRAASGGSSAPEIWLTLSYVEGEPCCAKGTVLEHVIDTDPVEVLAVGASGSWRAVEFISVVNAPEQYANVEFFYKDDDDNEFPVFNAHLENSYQLTWTATGWKLFDDQGVELCCHPYEP